MAGQRRQVGKSFAGFESEDKEASFKKGIECMFSYTKVAICSVGIKNMAQNFVLCCKNIMFVLHK